MNFLGLTDKEVACKGAARKGRAFNGYSVLPVPYDLTATYVKGAARGPAAIIDASAHIELYDEELGSEPWLAGVETLAPLGVESLPPEEMAHVVKASVLAIVEGGTVPVILGGEHGVTVGAVLALKETHPDLSVLQLDAHADLRDTYEGSPYNHACVARRVVEAGCPLVQVGIRSMSAEEGEFLAASPEKIKTVYASETVRVSPIDAEVVTDGLTDEVYITVDLDVFDPSVMPATGTPEPGGLGWYEVLEVLRTVALKKRVVGFDVVELCPIAGNIASDFMAARLVYKLMGYINR